jgi:uncharacterized protein YuzE
MSKSIYAKELRTRDDITYRHVEVIYDDIPKHISELIPDAVKIERDILIEYLSKSQIVAIELYKERTER